MPWKEIRVEEQRLLVIQEHEEGASISELSEIFEVSRKTIYKWVERYREQGPGGADRPQSASATLAPPGERGGGASYCGGAPALEVGVPGKLRGEALPGRAGAGTGRRVSTIAAVLQAKGLVVSRRHRPHTPVQRPPYANPERAQ